MKYLKRLYKYCTKTLFRKALSILLIILILLSSIKFVFLKPNTVLADSLFTFNEGYGTSINDNNGNVSAGTIANAVWKTEEFCKEGKCLYFDGTGDKITFADDADLDFVAADNFTIEGWFRTPDITTGQRTLIAKHNATAGGYKVYMDSNGYLIFGVDDDSTWTPDDAVSTTTAAFDDNKWHFFSAVKTGTTSITIYVDNIQYQTDSSIAATGTLANADSLLIGIDGDGSSNGFSGFIDGIKIYRSARTAAEIKTDYLGETPSRGVAASFGPDTSWISNGLVGYWKLDETSGNVTDSSGNGLTLTNNATTTFVAGKFGNGSEHVPASSQYFSTATAINGVKSVSFWTNPDITTNYFLSLTSGAYITSTSGTLSATGFTNPKIYINGIETTTLAANVWQLVTVTTETTIDANQFYVGRQDVNYYDGTIDEVRTYNRALTPAEVAKLYTWAPGPVGWWKMDESGWNGTSDEVVDSSGYGNSGTRSGNATTNLGKIGNAGIFDGSGDYITIPDDDTQDATTQITMAGWFYISSYNDWDALVMKSDSDADPAKYQFAVGTNNVFYFDFGQSGAWHTHTSDSDIFTTSQWTYLAVTYDGANVKFFRNGVQFGADEPETGSMASYASTANIFLGGLSGGYDGQVNMDDVRIYNYARTSGQIIEDMNGGHPAPGSPVGSSVAYWKFDEGYGTTAYDNSINANNLTLSTASWTNNGKFGKAFNGLTNVRASRATDPDLEFSATDDFTLSLWYKSDSANNPAATEYLMASGGPAGSAGYAIYANTDGTICFGIDDDTSWGPDVASCTPTDVYDNTWHHITAVRNVTLDTTKIYLDAVEKDSDTDSTTATLDSSPTFYIGDANATDGTDEFLGDIDEVKIFRSALTSDAIKVLYNQSSGQSLGSLSTDSSNNSSNSANDEYCPPGQGSACVGPVGHWKLDENTGTSAYDVSGNEGVGTITGASWAPGTLGQGLNFVSNDHVEISDADRFSIPTTGELTVMAWVYLRGESGGYPVSKFQTTGTNQEWSLRVNADETPRAFVDDNAGGTYMSAQYTTAISKRTWHHLAFTINSTSPSMKLFVDGSMVVESTTATGTINSNRTTPVRIGENANNAGDLDGYMDDVRIYNYVRTPAQIAWDMNQGNPLLHWKFDENTGSPTTLYDSSLNALNGTANGSMDSSDWLTGKFNSSLDFDGSDDVITRANAAAIDLNQGLSQGFTYSAWIYPNTVGETAGRIFQKSTNGSTTDSSSTFCRVAGSTPFDVECNLDLATSDAVLTVSAAAPANTWTHVAFSWTNDADDEVTVWINGVPTTSSASYDGDPTAESNILQIGGNGTTTSNTRAFDGQIDDFRIYSYELTSQQIKTLLNEGAAFRIAPVTGTP